MRIFLGQTRPIKGDIQHNIENHTKFIELAISHRADMVVFPELSITGYEPTLAKELATDKDDYRFDCLQNIADTKHMAIGIGVPTRNRGGINISMVLFQPGRARQIYSKEYLHADEEPFFVSGRNSIGLIGGESRIALAICYELSIPAHAERAFASGARIYLASVAKTANGVTNATQRLSEIAIRYSMMVLMCNCVGRCDNFQAAGKSAIFNDKAELVGQLDDANEGILMIDTATHAVIKKVI